MPLITQVYDRGSNYVSNDAVFGVKDSLVVDFKPLEGNDRANYELVYDFKLVRDSDTQGIPST
jgi:catechol 1,2-dioxygenase